MRKRHREEWMLILPVLGLVVVAINLQSPKSIFHRSQLTVYKVKVRLVPSERKGFEKLNVRIYLDYLGRKPFKWNEGADKPWVVNKAWVQRYEFLDIDGKKHYRQYMYGLHTRLDPISGLYIVDHYYHFPRPLRLKLKSYKAVVEMADVGSTSVEVPIPRM